VSVISASGGNPLIIDKGLGRIVKLLVAAVVTAKISNALPPAARFSLVFLMVLFADTLRVRKSDESPLYLEDIVTGILLYAGVGLLCCGLDHALSLLTHRHAGPVFPAIILAVIDKALLSSRRR